MFTGIIETTGTVLSATPARAGARVIRVRVPVAWRLRAGQSVAHDGCCLTVVKRGAGWAEYFLGPDTLAKTVAGGYRRGSRVNLERGLRIGDRLDGHLVQGHVDTTARVLACGEDGEAFRLVIEIPAGAAGLFIPQGSITVNGVSLTVAKLTARRFEIMLIPETWKLTNLSRLAPGDRVNLEYDLLGKYLRRLLHEHPGRAAGR